MGGGWEGKRDRERGKERERERETELALNVKIKSYTPTNVQSYFSTPFTSVKSNCEFFFLVLQYTKVESGLATLDVQYPHTQRLYYTILY